MNIIKQIRLKKKMTQFELANLVGVEQSTISKIERNAMIISIDTIGKMLSCGFISRKKLFAVLTYYFNFVRS